jgi:hypothetical protein
MPCHYCSATAVCRSPRGNHPLCRCCLQLTRRRLWDRLALRWLAHRPEDWSADVAAYLEVLHGGETPSAV